MLLTVSEYEIYPTTVPTDTIAPPIQLFHPVFGHFIDDLSNNLCVPPEIVKATVCYMRPSSAIYDNEAIRRAALEPHIRFSADSALASLAAH